MSMYLLITHYASANFVCWNVLYKSLFTEKRKQHKTHTSTNINKTKATTKSIKSNDTLYFPFRN